MDKTKSKQDSKEKEIIKWNEILCSQDLLEQLHEFIIQPLKHFETQEQQQKQSFQRLFNCILLYGGPGTGKTYLIKTCAKVLQCNLFTIQYCSLVTNKELSVQEQISKIFTEAREKKPSIIHFDEIDFLSEQMIEDYKELSNNAKQEFFNQIYSNNNDGILIIGETNKPQNLDPYLRKIFQKRILIPLPDQTIRQSLCEYFLKSTAHTLNNKDFKSLSNMTKDFTVSDVSIFIRDGIMQPIRLIQKAKKFKKVESQKYMPVENNVKGDDIIETNFQNLSLESIQLPNVTMKDFLDVIKSCKPSLTEKQIQGYYDWQSQFG